jgi:hypothetical protein
MTTTRLQYEIALITIRFLLIVCAAACAHPANAADRSGQTKRIDEQSLTGRWVRPDGGYILELRDFKKDGGLRATYFNPRPINVHLAAWSRQEGTIHVFVELRDINYPGSKYDLKYDPRSDTLRGTYYQAVEKQNYDIEFVRVK